jgi:peroxiredoxin
LERHKIQLFLLAYDNAEDNRKLAAEHKLTRPILLYKEGKVPAPFASQGTPTAYLLDEEGRVMKPLAAGFEEISKLVGEVLDEPVDSRETLAKSQIVRDGLKAGTRAPNFTLHDLNGETISLEQYRGDRVLLVFSDPQCGPCDQVTAELVRFDAQQRGKRLKLIMVGRGEVEDNRKKKEEHGVRFPFVIQDKWKLSKDYGIFATPVAFLIDENGLIINNVAVGSEPIMSLARQTMQPEKDNSYALHR